MVVEVYRYVYIAKLWRTHPLCAWLSVLHIVKMVSYCFCAYDHTHTRGDSLTGDVQEGGTITFCTLRWSVLMQLFPQFPRPTHGTITFPTLCWSVPVQLFPHPTHGTIHIHTLCCTTVICYRGRSAYLPPPPTIHGYTPLSDLVYSSCSLEQA